LTSQVDPPNEAPAVSVVIAALNEAESLPELIERIEAVFQSGFDGPRSFEVIVVDDGSSDGSRALLRGLAVGRPHLRPIFLRRNVGKSMALTSGFQKARGAYVVTLDADLQDNPEDIPALIEVLERGDDVIAGRREKRQDTWSRKLGSWVFNRTVRSMTGLDIQDLNCGFKAYRLEVVKSIAVYGQFHRYIPLLAYFAGFTVAECPVRNSPRKHGVSRYPTIRYRGLFDLFTILFVHKYDLSPLHFFAKIAAIFLIPSTLILGYFIGRHVLSMIGIGGEFLITERPLLSISLSMFLIGTNIFLTGFVCDFVLYHLIQGRIHRMSDLNIEEMINEAAPRDSRES
jgi:glycosyltransferase involved in cell wall biosynthesis